MSILYLRTRARKKENRKQKQNVKNISPDPPNFKKKI